MKTVLRSIIDKNDLILSTDHDVTKPNSLLSLGEIQCLLMCPSIEQLPYSFSLIEEPAGFVFLLKKTG